MSETNGTPATTANRRRGGLRRWTGRVLAGIGALSVVGLGTGLAIDLNNFDRTRGGYEAPYTGWTGTPIDWSAGGVTKTGIYGPGVVLDTTLDCTTGMVTMHAFGLSRDWRKVSPRAIAVHKPREACIAAGFTPQF